MSADPSASSEPCGWHGALLRCWSGTSALMVQPPLDHHYLVMHLGGAKRVTRRRDGPAVSAVVDCGSLTLVPAGTAFVWKTEGPISFAHLYIEPRQLEAVAAREFDGSGCGAAMTEAVGLRDPLLEPLLGRMILEISNPGTASTLLLDSLYDSLCVRLAHKHMPRSPRRTSGPVALAPFRLRRVLEFIDAHLGCDLTLADLAAAAGTSQSHFSRAFHDATGSSPYRYLVRRRIDLAKVLLVAGSEPLAAVSERCGFNSAHQFAVMFKRAVGVGPKRFRTAHATEASRSSSQAMRPLRAM